MLEFRGRSEGECVDVCLGVFVEVRSQVQRRGSGFGEVGSRLQGLGIPDEDGSRGTGFTSTPPLILIYMKTQRETIKDNAPSGHFHNNSMNH